MFLLHGSPLQIDVPFVHMEIQYPANWLRLASPEEKTALGITEVADQVRPDDQYYWVTQNADGSYTSTPKDLAQLKTNAIKQAQETVWLMLQKTDYMDSRKANDPTYVAPEAWVTWRASVRSAMTAATAAINAAADVDALIAAKQINWPKDPDANSVQVEPA